MKNFIIFIVLLFLERSCTSVQNDNIFSRDNHFMIYNKVQENRNIQNISFFKIDDTNNETNIVDSSKNELDLYKYEDNSNAIVDIDLIPVDSQQIIYPDSTECARINIINATSPDLSEQTIPKDTSKADTSTIVNVELKPFINVQTQTKDTSITDSNSTANLEIAPAISNQTISTDTTKIDSNTIAISDSIATTKDSTKVSPWLKTVALGFNLGYLLERNNPLAPNTDVITFTSAFNFGLSYFKDSSKYEMTNELHYLSSIQNESATGGIRLKRVQDDLTTLHDISYGITKNNKLRLNLILRFATPVFTIYNGDYYKDYNSLGPTQSFLSPYDFIISPGIKYQPNEFLRMSFSIYAFQLYGVANYKIAQKGIFITDFDENCKYKNFLFKHLGAEFNLWYDGQVKEWLFVQYRLSVSTDFFESFGKNGLVDGLFITRIKIFKDFYLSHQAMIKTNFAVNFLKPFYNQMLLFTYEKTF
jgi:hypothetical protein